MIKLKDIKAPPKKGRPRIEDKGKSFEATKPWLKEGMSRRTWYRRREEKRKEQREMTLKRLGECLVDPKVYELAEHFLSDIPCVTPEDITELAYELQERCELFCHILR